MRNAYRFAETITIYLNPAMLKPTLDFLAVALAEGRTTSRALVEECLALVDDPAGQGSTVFLQVDRDAALSTADAMDKLRSACAVPSRYAGIPISVKDIFDIEGQITRAGSRVLGSSAPAQATATAVTRLRAAGFVIIGRTNMTEFAFSGLGLNPHYGTPLSPWRRNERHIAGGSSSGAAASVADSMAHAALGTDTGGSCRIPAAFTGLVGFKPTAGRVPKNGTIPLSTTLDTIGPIARSVSCCAALDAFLTTSSFSLAGVGLSHLRILVPKTIALDGMEAIVASTFERTLDMISAAGARITITSVQELAQIPIMNAKGGFSAAESFAWHSALLKSDSAEYDPRVVARIRRGEQQSAVDFISLLNARSALIDAFTQRMANFDIMILPTVPITPPKLSDLSDDNDYTRINLLVLRNPAIVNMIDGCAISIPMHREDEPPMGLMVAGCNGEDRRVLITAAAIERLLSKR